MADFLDKVIGFYHFAADRAPKQIPQVRPKPRTPNPWRANGQALVSKATADDDIKASVARTIGLLGTLSQAVNTGDRVLVKPNFNSAQARPGGGDGELQGG